jgi:hypothetical protein
LMGCTWVQVGDEHFGQLCDAAATASRLLSLATSCCCPYQIPRLHACLCLCCCRLRACLQVESHLSHAPLATRKVARALAVFLLSYATAFMETLTISHVSGSSCSTPACGAARHA